MRCARFQANVSQLSEIEKKGGGSMILEPRIQVLAEVMERIPGVSVLSGCGGHEEPPDQSHLNEGKFIVTFIIERDRVGFRALHLITFGCSEVEFKGKGEAHVIAKWAKTVVTEGKILCFDLEGTANPDDIADSIQAMFMILTAGSSVRVLKSVSGRGSTPFERP
jgi:hypothetical protein